MLKSLFCCCCSSKPDSAPRSAEPQIRRTNSSPEHFAAATVVVREGAVVPRRSPSPIPEGRGSSIIQMRPNKEPRFIGVYGPEFREDVIAQINSNRMAQNQRKPGYAEFRNTKV